MKVNREEFIRLVTSTQEYTPRIENVYRLCVEDVRREDLRKAESSARLHAIMRDLTIGWGNMERVLYRDENKGWERRAGKAIARNATFLAKARHMDLRTAKEERYRKKTKKVLNELATPLGPTAASKVLHILAPRFFPLLDGPIRSYATKHGEGMRGMSNADGRGYLAFIAWSKRLLDQTARYSSALKRDYGETELRFLDCYLWKKAQTQPKKHKK